MAENKTKPTNLSAEAYIAAITDESRRKDCKTLVKLMSTITKQKATMWGPSIVGFGSYHYRYDSGREGDACLAGFSSRKPDLSIYLAASFPGQERLLSRLGKHRMATACLYVRRLADVDLKVLEQLIAGAVAEVQRRYG